MNDTLIVALVVSLIVVVILVVRVVVLSGTISDRAMQQFQVWREADLGAVRLQANETATQQAAVQLEQWKLAFTSSTRADAIQRSKSVITGKVIEHLVPYFPDFPYNPKDARFIGSPVDLVVFDGLDEGTIDQIVFVEIKTGDSSLTKRERQIKQAVLSGKVTWKELRKDDFAATTPTTVVAPDRLKQPTVHLIVTPHFNMPGWDNPEATVVSWLAKPGDTVAVGQPLVEIENEHMSMGIGAEVAGQFSTLVGLGAIVREGSPLAEILVDADSLAVN